MNKRTFTHNKAFFPWIRSIVGLVALVSLVSTCLPQDVFATAGLGANIVINQSFERAWTADQNTALSWNNYQAGFVRTRDTAHTGTYSAKVTNSGVSTAGVYQRIDLNQSSLTPVWIGGYIKGSNISAAAGTTLGASIYAEIHLQNGQVVYWNSAMNTGTFDWRWAGFNTASLTAVTGPINHIFVVGILGNSSGTAYFDDFAVQNVAPQQAAVTIMFDDGNTSDYTIAKPALAQYYMPASTAIITGQVGIPGRMNWNQIRELSQAGWEIMSHTVSHVDLTTLSASQLETELSASKSALTSQWYTIKNLALPYGTYNGTVVAAASRYYSSIRPYEIGSNPQATYPERRR